MKLERTRDEEEYKIFDIRLGFFCDYFIFLLEYIEEVSKMFLHSYDFTFETRKCIHFIYKCICKCVIYYSLRKMKMSVGVRYDTFG